MMKTCPQCGFESIDAQKKCPNCGFEFVKADEANEKEAPHTNETVSEKNPQQNDDIRWSDFKDVPLGELIEHFEDKNETDESKEQSVRRRRKRARADNEPKYRTDTRFKRNAIRCVRNDRITVT